MSRVPGAGNGRLPRARPLVLIVDGDHDTREMYDVALPALGFDAITASDTAEALQRVQEARPDIIVTELVLPIHGGYDLLQDLKGHPETRNIPVIVLTGDEEPLMRERAARDGCAAFLVKPCLLEDLAAALRDVLVRHTSAG